MRTITEVFDVYSFDELSEEVQAKVLDKFRDTNTNYDDWNDSIIDGWKEDLNTIGFGDAEIMYSGFYSQGDGACFTSKWFNMDFLFKHFLEKYPSQSKLLNRLMKLFNSGKIWDSGSNIYHNFNYYHSRSTSLRFNIEIESKPFIEYPNVEEAINALEEMIIGEMVSLGNRIYKDLGDSYEELRSDEAVKESIIANDYEFHQGGDLYD